MSKEIHTGGSSGYYTIEVATPQNKEQDSYLAECVDIMEALQMTYSEANAFKAIWRMAASRNTSIVSKKGNNSIYDSEKVVFFGNRMLEQAKRLRDPMFENYDRINEVSDCTLDLTSSYVKYKLPKPKAVSGRNGVHKELELASVQLSIIDNLRMGLREAHIYNLKSTVRYYRRLIKELGIEDTQHEVDLTDLAEWNKLTANPVATSSEELDKAVKLSKSLFKTDSFDRLYTLAKWVVAWSGRPENCQHRNFGTGIPTDHKAFSSTSLDKEQEFNDWLDNGIKDFRTRKNTIRYDYNPITYEANPYDGF